VREETGARVVFPGPNDTDKTLIVIMGKESGVGKAKEILEAQISNLENITEVELDIDQKHHKHFVARRGAILRDISDEFGGVTISFPRINEDSSVVKIKGPSECVDGAKSRMEAIVDDLENHVTIELEVDEKYHRTLIGQKGKNVQAVISQFNVQVRFPNRNGPQATRNNNNNNEPAAAAAPAPPQENGIENGKEEDAEVAAVVEEFNRKLILISGHKDKCQEAKEALEALVPISEEVSVPYKYHRYIIGQKGLEVRKLMTDYDVNISIPAADLNSDVITITGTAGKLENAKLALADRVKVIEGEEEDRALRNFVLPIEIPKQYHSQIIGRRGAIVSELRKKHDVIIQFPDNRDPEKPAENPNQIRLQGYERNVESCKKAIEAIVSTLESHVSIDVHIDRRFHPRLIGTKGRAINKIMSDYGVNISFPKDADIVTVTGQQDKVEECIEYILNLEEEFMQDIEEQEESRRFSQPRGGGNTGGPNRGGGGHNNRNGPQSQPFMVRDAPWHQQVDTNNMEDFPSLGNQSDAGRTAAPTAWGRRM